ncbi:hypothetical protein HRbin11_02036 [bacterium HR11]|nr:hypothetical protein HRbin11_02036 [bacterium HR11]
MEIRGTLKTMSLPDLLRWLSESQQTGALVFQVGPVRKKLFFQNGALVAASSSDPREFLGQFLLRRGWISEAQLIKAVEEQIQTGRVLGRLLIEKGWLTEEQLKSALREKACDTVYSLFLSPEATFEFHAGEAPPYEIVPLGLPVEAIIMEGVYRKDEWERIRQVLPALERTILQKASDAVLPSELRSDPRAERVLRLINGRRSLREIALLLYETDFEVVRIAAQLYEKRVVAITSEVPIEQDTERPQIPLGMLVEACQVKVREGRLDEALRMVEYIESHYTDLPQEVHALQGLVYGKVIQQFRDQVPPTAIPVLRISLDDLVRYRLDPMQGFMVTRINGLYDLKTLRNLVPVSEERFYILLKKLVDMGIVGFQPGK